MPQSFYGKLNKYSTNSSNIQVRVNGFKQVYSSGGLTVKTNGEVVRVELYGNFTASAWTNLNVTIPDGYRPPNQIRVFHHTSSSGSESMFIQTDGKIQTTSAMTNKGVNVYVEYHLR